MISKLLGLAEPIRGIIDDISTSDEERIKGEIEMAKVRQATDLAQIEVNKIEAAHSSVFVAGWRPFIGWCCGVGIAVQFLVTPIISPWYKLAPIETELLVGLVTILLGSAGLRTFEKLRGVQANAIKLPRKQLR